MTQDILSTFSKRYKFLLILIFISLSVRTVYGADQWFLYSSKEAGVLKIKKSELATRNLSLSSFSIWTTKNTKIDNTSHFDHRDLTEIPYVIKKDNDGEDAVFFYIHPTVEWQYDRRAQQWKHIDNIYTDRSFIYLSSKSSTKSITHEDCSEDLNANTLDYFERLYSKSFHEYNLNDSGQDWFSNVYNISTPVDIENPITDRCDSVQVVVQGIASSKSSSTAYLEKNGTQVSSSIIRRVTNVYEGIVAFPFTLKTTVKSNSESLRLYLSGVETAKYYLDYFRFISYQPLSLGTKPIYFQNSKVALQRPLQFNYKLSNVTSSSIVWDISSPLEYVQVDGTVKGADLLFKDSHEQMGRYVAFSPKQGISSPLFEKELINVDTNFNISPDYIIIYHKTFKKQAFELKKIHDKELVVDMVDIDDIFLKFGGNIYDPNVIRNYIKKRYDSQLGTDHPLKYLLLFGGGTFDPISPISASNPNYIPTFQSKNSLDVSNSFVSDDVYGLMQEGENELVGTLDIGVGRVPCSNQEEANTFVDKVRGYLDPANRGDWCTRTCVIADDEDYGLHLTDAEKISDYIVNGYPSMHLFKIYLDAYTEQRNPSESYPEVTQDITKFMKDGGLLMNYTGHAGIRGLASEMVLSKEDIGKWNNGYHLPLFVTATCELSRWDLKDRISAGEMILFNPNGGGIGLFSTTRIVYSSSNYILNKNIYNAMFRKDENGEYPRLGTVIKNAKKLTYGAVNRRKFALLGDPALRLVFPKWTVNTVTVDEQKVDLNQDVTIKLLDPVSVEAEIKDELGNEVSVDGEVIIKVLDKPIEVQTLGNGGQKPQTYKEQKNILFQTKVPVVDGKFEFVFVLPKDVSYEDGEYRISYYFKNDNEDAIGDFTRLKTDGISSEGASDIQGPKLSLSINEVEWEEGMTIGKEPMWTFNVEDQSGINTSLSSVGHQMVMILDNDNNKRFVLNKGFEFMPGSYTSGVIHWNPLDLTPGSHHFKVKVWDLLNNSSTMEGEFVVEPFLQMHVTAIYPNPTKGEFQLQLKHNMAYSTVDTNIEIYDFKGALLWNKQFELTQNVYNESFNLPHLGITSPGVYLLRVNGTNKDGNKSNVVKKIILEN